MASTPTEIPIQREMTPDLRHPDEIIPAPRNSTDNQKPNAKWAPAQCQYPTQSSSTNTLAFEGEENISKEVTQGMFL